MKWFYNLRIIYKLLIAFVALSAILVFQGMMGLRSIMKTGELSDEMYALNLVPTNKINEINRTLYQNRLLLFEFLGEQNDEDLRNQILERLKVTAQIPFQLVDAHQSMFPEVEQQELQAFIQQWQAVLTNYDEIIDLVDNYDFETAYVVARGNNQKLYDEAVGTIESIVAHLQQQSEQNYQTNQTIRERTHTLMLIIIVSGILIAVLLAAVMTRIVTLPVRIVVARLKDIAQGEGDLTRRLEVATQDEIGELASWFNRFIDQLNTIIIQVQQNGRHIASASRQIAEGNQNLAKRTESQSASLEETASAIEEMTATVEHNAENATHANRIGKKMKSVAETGKAQLQEVVSKTSGANQKFITTLQDNNEAFFEKVNTYNAETTKAMEDITESAEKISWIINVIEDLASQTNLLALNASVEAARAGEHGKGFAVVAAEVRKLAHRSAKASKEIGELIKVSLKQVNKGAQIADQSNQAIQDMLTNTETMLRDLQNTFETSFDELLGKVEQDTNLIIESATEVSDMVENIDAASSEQAQGIQQINVALSEMERVTQQNATLVEETASASQEMAEQSKSLIQMMKRFKTIETVEPVETEAEEAEPTDSEPMESLPARAKPMLTKDQGPRMLPEQSFSDQPRRSPRKRTAYDFDDDISEF